MKKIIKFDPKIISLIQNSYNEKGQIKPFVQELFLLDCHIAGTTYVDITSIEPSITIGDNLILQREPDNKHDPLATLIFTIKGEKLGYIPRDKNEVIARLLDGGKIIFGKLENKKWVNDWLKVNIRIFMSDL